MGVLMGTSIFTQAFYCGNCALTVIVSNESAHRCTFIIGRWTSGGTSGNLMEDEMKCSLAQMTSLLKTNQSVQWRQYSVCFNVSHKQILHRLSNECQVHISYAKKKILFISIFILKEKNQLCYSIVNIVQLMLSYVTILILKLSLGFLEINTRLSASHQLIVV